VNGVEFHFETTVPNNVASSYSTGTGGTCSLQSGAIEVHGGSVSSEIEGETLSVAFGNTIDVSFTSGAGFTTLNMSGDVTVSGLCAGDGYDVVIATPVPVTFPDGSLDPSNGVVTGNGEVVDVTGVIPEICDGEVFQ
jgi:hypothetical protein